MRSLHPRSLASPPRQHPTRGGRAADVSAAPTLLGATHPLVGVLRAARTTVEQMRVVAGAQTLGVGVLVLGFAWGLALLAAATVVQAGLGLRLLLLIETRHDVCRELIISGRAPQRLTVVASEWRRLADPRQRARLAQSFEKLAATAAHPLSPAPGARPYFSVRVVSPIAAELGGLGTLLRSDAAGVPGVALAERLLTFPGSPLWGADTSQLAQELARIRYLLAQSPTVSERS
jgi:hypothetical protein